MNPASAKSLKLFKCAETPIADEIAGYLGVKLNDMKGVCLLVIMERDREMWGCTYGGKCVFFSAQLCGRRDEHHGRRARPRRARLHCVVHDHGRPVSGENGSC